MKERASSPKLVNTSLVVMSIRKFPLVLLVFICTFFIFPASPIQPATHPLKESDQQKSVHQDGINKVADYLSYIDNHSSIDEVSLPLVMAVIKAESNFDPNAISHKGALGLMQLMPVTALEQYNRFGLNVTIPILKKNLLVQPELNLLLGIEYIKTLTAQLSGVHDNRSRQLLVLAAYNSGLTTVKRSFGCKGTRCLIWRVNNSGKRFFIRSIRLLPLETRKYITTVEKAFQYYSQVFYRGEIIGDFVNQI